LKRFEQVLRGRAAAALAAAALLCLTGCSKWTAAPATYVGSASCASCHTDQMQAWNTSDHKWAMQLPDSAHVLGDVDGASFTHFDDVYRFVHSGEEDGPKDISVIARRGTGEEAETDTLAVQWTFGHDPLQQFLVAGNRGRLQALTVAWDVEEERWYSLYPDEATPPGDVLDWQSDQLSWNYMCAACHTTGLKRGYDIATDSYETTWAEHTVGCEACHGPGSEHLEDPAASYGMTGASQSLQPVKGREDMTVLENEMTMCAACHSRRTPLVEPTVHGESFLDQYAPALISDGLYYDNGEIQDEVYVYGSFLQSGMAQAGVTCSDCHDPHTGERRLPGDALCLSCHAGTNEEVPIHIAHEDSYMPLTCETCHMPKRTYMGTDARGDHRFGIPDPMTSRQVGARNVCADCHGENSRVEQLLAGPESRPGMAIAALRAGTTDRMALVQDVLVDSTVSRFEKGSLIARLGSEPTTDALRVVMTALSSGNPFERVGALRAIADPAFRGPMPNLDNQFADSLRWVRVEAVAAALTHGYSGFGEEPAKSALADYEMAQLAVAEQPEAHLNLASLYEVTGSMEKTRQSFEQAQRMAPDNPDIATGFGLMLGRWANRMAQSEAEDKWVAYRTLRTEGEEQLARAVSLQQESGTKETLSETLTLLGLYLGEERPRLPAAAEVLDYAWRQDATNRQALYNAAVSWHQVGDTDAAEERYRLGMERHPDTFDFADGLIVLLMQTDRWEEASAVNTSLLAALPGQTQWLERQALIDTQRRQLDNPGAPQDS